MKRFIGILLTITMLALVSFLGSAFSQGQSELANPHKIVHRLRGDQDLDKNKEAHPNNAKPQRGNGINYHGGAVILGGPNVYYIWYGNWSGNSATSILTDFAGHIGGWPYFNINTTYYDGAGTDVSNIVLYKGQTIENYSHSTSRRYRAIQPVVSSAITSAG